MGIKTQEELAVTSKIMDDHLNPNMTDRDFGYALILVPFKDNPDGQLQMISNFMPEIALNLITDASRLFSVKDQTFNVDVKPDNNGTEH
jgi:hypothetical protein